MKSNIILIGMPSAGKTTTGKPLAEKLGKSFLDTDAVMVEQLGVPLRQIVQDRGMQHFLDLQERVILGLSLQNQVVSTGGSVIFRSASMEHLKSQGVVVYLHLGLDELIRRLGPDRRLARNEGQTYEDVFNERKPLYENYADIVIHCDGKTEEEIILEIIDQLE